jgi:hypothetical protein
MELPQIANSMAATKEPSTARTTGRNYYPMHYHLEIIMPPTDDVEAAIEQIMKPFDENGDQSNEDHSPKYGFWDYWKVGGRWSGNKLLAGLDPAKLEAFYATLNEKKITVSSFQAGKQALQPADQAEIVDAIWNEFFPQAPTKVCPIFDNYKGSSGDVMELQDVPENLKCSHIIIAGPHYTGDGLEAKHMMQESIWNGVTHCETKWDGTLFSALADNAERLSNARPDYAAKHLPKGDWLVVTVDYHS